jgi:arylsulfatase A-like enzyme
MKKAFLPTLLVMGLMPALLVAAADKPNIIFILVDDLGYADVGFNGSTWYETPAIDQLAKEGLVLEQAYMYPSCSPSRTGIFTGKQSFRTGVFTVPVLEQGSSQENIFSRWTVELKHTLYPQVLQEQGYKSIHLGKWHLVGPYPSQELAMDFPLKKKLSQPSPSDFSWVAHHKTPEIQAYYPEGRGFIKNVGGTYRGDPALEKGGYNGPTGGYFAPFSNPFIEQKPDDEWLTDRLTDEAIAFMHEHRAGPFYINLNYYTVHRPLRARSEALLQKYLAKPGDPVTGQGLGKKKEENAKYASMIESLDDNIQRVVDFLDENDLRKNTLIVFTSDNGQNGVQSSNLQLRGSKGYIYEGGIRVPTLVNWPGKVHARRCATPISLLDFFPTFIELAGAKNYSGVLDGDSFTPLFKGDSERLEERPLFWHLASRWKHGTCSVIRKGPYKLIQFLKDGELELYHLEDDELEAKNLAAEKPEIAQQLLKELVAWRKHNHVALPPHSPLRQ